MRAIKIIAVVVLTWIACGAMTYLHDARVSADLARIWEQREGQRLEAVQAIHETEDADLRRLGLID